MGSVQENLTFWTSYGWELEGDEWSNAWGGTEVMWYSALWPRLHSLLPTGHVLEIAPGFGRCTQYLLPLCDHLTVVDLTPRCIEACRERFDQATNLTAVVNDGTSLEMIEDGSIDFVFSWDSLVHAESDVLEQYLRQLAEKLKPGASGFIHHSTIGDFRSPTTGQIMVENAHWRAASMTAELFRTYCSRFGLHCVAQERVNWEGEALTDAFSYFVRPLPGRECTSTIIIENPRFMADAQQAARLSDLLRPADRATEESASQGSVSTEAMPTEVRRLRRHVGALQREASELNEVIEKLKSAQKANSGRTPRQQIFDELLDRTLHGDLLARWRGGLKSFSFDRGHPKDVREDVLTITRADGVEVSLRLHPDARGIEKSPVFQEHQSMLVVSRDGNVLFLLPAGA